MPEEHREKRRRAPSGAPAIIYPSGVARRWFGVVAVVAVVVASVAAVALSSHGGNGPAHPKPAQVQLDPNQQLGDTADLMRRLERKKLVMRSQ